MIATVALPARKSWVEREKGGIAVIADTLDG